MDSRSALAVILAAGEGTRMRSPLPKVLHAIAGRTLIGHVVAAVQAAGITRIAVVIGPGHEAIRAEIARIAPKAAVFVQQERRGTAHAVLAARVALQEPADDVLVLYGDTPLVRPETLRALRAPLAEGASVSVLGFRPADPSGYGRLVMDGAALAAIREERDASATERQIPLCNAGLMAFAGRDALALLDGIGNANSKSEYYLTDAVEIARGRGLSCAVTEAPEEEVQGVNTQGQLAAAEAVIQARLRAAAMEAGVTMTAPETVYLSADTRLAPGVTVEPFVVFGPGVSVEAGSVVHAFSHLVGATVGAGVSVGPYARLRPGAALRDKSRVGNFVEVKEALIEAGAKVNHLTYIGDAWIGAGANIGAGTITCNYDGHHKYRTTIGAGAFIGSNSALVAPVTIGEGAFVGSGSVINHDVPPHALAIGRARQVVKEDGAHLIRAKAAATTEKAAATAEKPTATPAKK